MGVDRNALDSLRLAKREGVDFDCTLMIGRQRIYLDPPPPEPYAEGLFRELGAREVAAFDRSAYEGAAILHDLGVPIPDDLRGRFSVVFDAGTLEHVFNVPQALKNCMEMVAVGGHLIICTGVNNFCGHGFYQFSPELFFRALSAENGFADVRMIACDAHPESDWFAVDDPATVGARVDIVGPYQVMVLVRAKRIARVEPFGSLPQQADYERAWGGGAHADHGVRSVGSVSLRRRREGIVPSLIDRIRRRRSAAQFQSSAFRRVPRG